MSKPEFEEETYTDEHGHAGSKSLDQEIIAGEWQKLTGNETYKNRTRAGRIIAMHQAVSNRIKQLEKLFYQLVRNHPDKATKLLEEIKRLRYLQEYLLQAYIWEQNGVGIKNIPEELEELI